MATNTNTYLLLHVMCAHDPTADHNLYDKDGKQTEVLKC